MLNVRVILFKIVKINPWMGITCNKWLLDGSQKTFQSSLQKIWCSKSLTCSIVLLRVYKVPIWCIFPRKTSPPFTFAKCKVYNHILSFYLVYFSKKNIPPPSHLQNVRFITLFYRSNWCIFPRKSSPPLTFAKCKVYFVVLFPSSFSVLWLTDICPWR